MCPPPPVDGPVAAIPPPPAYPHPQDVAARGEFKGRKVEKEPVGKENAPQNFFSRVYYLSAISNFTGPKGNKIWGVNIQPISKKMLLNKETMSSIIKGKLLVHVKFNHENSPVQFGLEREMVRLIMVKKAEEVFLKNHLIPDARVAPLSPGVYDYISQPAVYKKFIHAES